MEAIRERFEEVFQKHLPEVERLAARSAANPDDAQDLVQEIFVRAYDVFDRFVPGTNVGAWLHTVAVNVCTNAAKARLRYQQHVIGELEDWQMPAGLCDAVDEFVRKQDHSCLRRAMASLSSAQLLVLNLRFSDGLTLPEIAQVLGIPVDTVKSRLRTALGRLQSAYSFQRLDAVDAGDDPAIEVVRGWELGQFIVDRERGGRVYHSLGSLYLRKGLVAAALQEWGRAQEVAPTFLDAYLDSAQQYVVLDQPEKAVETLETAVSRIRNADLHVRLANLYVDKLDDVDEGIQHSTRALEMEPANPSAHYAAGRVYSRQASVQERLAVVHGTRHLLEDSIMASLRTSSSHLEEAIRIQPVFPKARLLLARNSLDENKVERALSESRAALDSARDDEYVMYYAGWICHMAHQMDTAEQLLRESLASRETPRKWGVLAFVLQQMARPEEAYDALLTSLELDTDKTTKATTAANIAAVALELKRYDDAVEYAEAAMHWNPNHVHSYCNLARAHLRRGDSPHIAINLCKQGLQVHSIHICFPRILAEAYYRLNKHDDALAHITEAVEREPQEAQWWLLRAKILTAMGRLDEARCDVDAALEREPDNEEAVDRLEEIEKAGRNVQEH